MKTVLRLYYCLFLLLSSHFFYSQNEFVSENKKDVLPDTALFGKLLDKLDTLNNFKEKEALENFLLHEISLNFKHYPAGTPIGKCLRVYVMYLLTHISGRSFAEGKDEEAINLYFEILKLAEEINDKGYISTSYSNIGSCYVRAGEDKIALNYFLKSLVLFSQINDKEGITRVNFNIARVCMKLQHLTKALYYSNKTLQYAEKWGDKKMAIKAGILIARIQDQKGETENAQKRLEDILSKIKDTSTDLEDLTYVRIYLSKINRLQHHYKKALQFINEAEELNANNENLIVKKNIVANKLKLFKSMNNFKEALVYSERLTEINRNIDAENIKIILLKKQREHAETTQREIEELKNHAKTQKLEQKKKAELFKKYIIIGSVALLFLMLTAMFLLQVSLIKNKKNKLEKEKLSTELNFLRSQINPHFLFNCINNLYFQIDRKNEVARNTLFGFSEILRYQLYDCEKPTVPIEKEVDYLTNYINLQLLRKDKLLNCSFEVEPTVKNFEIAPLLIIPFIENAFKHVSNKTDKENLLSVSLNKNETHFFLNIINDKDHFSERKKGPKGIGIQNVKRRLELLYPKKYELTIRNEPIKYEVILKINLQ